MTKLSEQQPSSPPGSLRAGNSFPGDAADSAQNFGASATARQEAKQHGWLVLAVLSLLMGFASISTDLYLPAMPAMQQALNTDTGTLEWTISGYLIGFSIGQLFWGPISDRYGRRVPVAIGLLLFVAGSAGCAMAGSAWAVVGWRVVQALGACASVVLSRAMVRDLYQGHRAAQMMSTLITVMAIAPLVGPLVGGQILIFSGWRAIFWLLVGIGVFTLFALFTLPETLAHKNRNHEPLAAAFRRYGVLMRNPVLLAYAVAGGFYYAGIFAYISGTPFAYIDYYHLSPQYYGLLFALGIMGIMASNVVNIRLLPRIGHTRLLLWGTSATAVIGLMLYAVGETDFGGLSGLVLLLFFYVSTNGFIVANSIAGALEHFPRQAGAVSALVGSMQYGSGILSSAAVGVFADGTPAPMCAVMALCGIGAFLCAKLVPQESHNA